MQDKAIPPDVITFNILIDAFVKEGRMEEVLAVFGQMTRRDVRPNVVTYGSLLNGWCQLGHLEEAEKIFDMMVKQEMCPNTIISNLLLDSHFDKRLMEKSQNLFDPIVQHWKVLDIISYSTLIKGYCLLGEMDKAEKTFGKIEAKGVLPNFITYYTIIKGYIKVKRNYVALELLKDMIQKVFCNYVLGISAVPQFVFARLKAGQTIDLTLDVIFAIPRTGHAFDHNPWILLVTIIPNPRVGKEWYVEKTIKRATSCQPNTFESKENQIARSALLRLLYLLVVLES
ncbi:Pentatricopeptide repeat [Parasponia andersonii]|uniref:Pentatricopeptide repeat n=1 Tax=Parasponia andersonii TaxID=3476 RepID=A0A2P5D4F5_PARAD|nr:Pentatricopeptide repeat [Parasponia andersonii]